MKKTFFLINPKVRELAKYAISQAEDGFMVTIQPKTRNNEQNSKMWAILGEISKQVVWHGKKLTPENWKDVLTASLRKQEVVIGLDSNFVVLGQSTSKMSIKDMSEVIELALNFAALHEVRLQA